MAKVNFKIPEEFLLKISKLADKTDEIIPKVLKAGGDVANERVRSNLQAVIDYGTKEESRSTGELLSALGLTTAKLDKNGNYNVKVGFAEPRSDGTSNAKIANILEYGKHNQPAKPFLKPAKSQTRDSCIEAMKLKFEQEVESV